MTPTDPNDRSVSDSSDCRLTRPELPARGSVETADYSAVSDLPTSPSPEQGEGPGPIPVQGCFGPYELLQKIAVGGMGVVYQARHRTLNRVVALKMIRAGELATVEQVHRFHTEAQAAARLDHPGIVPVFEVGEHDGQHYYSMGFVDGGSLAAPLRERPMPPREGARVVEQVARTIAYAHQQGVIHRDHKPANILLDRNGQPKVTDFGLARHVASDSHVTVSGQVLGTPSYMPPE